MSYHDKLLSRVRESATTPGKLNIRRALLRGVREISLHPTKVSVDLGSLYDDARAIAADMRKAAREVRLRD